MDADSVAPQVEPVKRSPLTRAQLDARARALHRTATHEHAGMVVWAFTTEGDALDFAEMSEGMLIRGLVRGAVMVAAVPAEVAG